MTLRKPNRRKRQDERRRKHLENRDYHHNLAKSRGGSNQDFNLIVLKVERHQMLHKIFGNRTLREIISVLERLDKKKSNQK